MNISLKKLAGAVVGLALGSAVVAASAADITGAGASFPYPIYGKWSSAYKGKSGVGLNYQSIGSGGGIAQIKAKTVTFGASDMPLKADELADAGLVQFPTVIGGVVPVVNIAGVGANQLTLDGTTLANIYLGKISKWDDPAIKALNPSVNLPSKAIVVVHRSDGSGTTFLFANYLAKVSPSWDDKVGAATSVEWPSGIGAKGNEGVAGNVAQTAGSIGYVELAYALQNHLASVKMVNKDGATVTASIKSFAAAAANANWASAPGMYLVLSNEAGAETWPIAGATFILMYKQPTDPAQAKSALDFFRWAYKDGDAMAESLDYVPLPDSVVDLIETKVFSQIQAQ